MMAMGRRPHTALGFAKALRKALLSPQSQSAFHVTGYESLSSSVALRKAFEESHSGEIVSSKTARTLQRATDQTEINLPGNAIIYGLIVSAFRLARCSSDRSASNFHSPACAVLSHALTK